MPAPAGPIENVSNRKRQIRKDEINLDELAKVARLHATKREIAEWFRCAMSTLDNDPYHTVIIKAQNETKQRLKQKALQRALEDNSDVMLKFCLINYAGWTGRVWIRYNREPDSWGSDGFGNTLTHTGTGGYGSYDGPWKGISNAHFTAYGHTKPKTRPNTYSWDYRFFADDWPMVNETELKHKNWAALQNKKYEGQHTFMWEDEETKNADKEFLNNYQTLQVKK